MARPKLDIPEGVTCVSPSQMSTAMRCWRLWAFQYIEGLREPGGRGAAFGNRVHEVHEDYLNGVGVPDITETWTFRAHLEGEIASAAEHNPAATELLRTTSDNVLDKQMFPGKVALNMMPQGVYPAPGTGTVEHHFVYKRTKDIWYQGLMDWHAYDPETRRLKVLDHKTSLDPKKYGLVTEAPHEDDPEPRGQLRTDHQGLIYARAGLDMYIDSAGREPPPEGVDLCWSYGKSDGVRKHSYVAEAHFDNVGEIYARFENDVHPWAVEMHRLKRMRAAPLSLDPSPGSCRAFNRLCSHAAACNLTTEEKLGALMSATAPNPLLAKILANANAAAVAAPTPAPVPAAVAAPVPAAVAAPAATPAAAAAALGVALEGLKPPAPTPVAAAAPTPVAAAVAAPVPAPVPAPAPVMPAPAPGDLVSPPEAHGPVAAVAAPLAPVPGQGAPVVSTLSGVLPPAPVPAPVAGQETLTFTQPQLFELADAIADRVLAKLAAKVSAE